MTTESIKESLVPAGPTIAGLADRIPVMVSVVDADLNFLFVNQAYANWLGIPRDQVIGKQAEEVVPVDSTTLTPEARRAAVREVIETGGEKTAEYSVRHPVDKGWRRVVATFVAHPNGCNAFVFFRDVTEERKSQANEAKYRALVDTAGEGVIVINSRAIIQSFNKAAEKLFGYDAEEVIGKNLKMLMPSPYAENHDGYVKHYLDTGVPKIMGKAGVEACALRKDGTTFPADLAVAEFRANGETFFTGIVRDISERKEHEAAVRQWNDNLEAEILKRSRTLDQIFNLSDDILAILGFDGTFKSVSPSAERMTGVPVERAIGDRIPYYAFAVEDDREELIDIFARATHGEQITGYEFRVRNLDGSFRWTSWNIRPVVEDEIILLVGRDVTMEKLREENLRQSQKMEAIGQLTGGIAHDFNNLLMGIMGSLDIMNRKLPDESRELVEPWIEGAGESAKRAAGLTHRLLAFSRRQSLAPVPVDVNSLVCGMSTLIDRTIGPEIEVVVQEQADLWATKCDPNQLENGLLNLMLNARDAMSGQGTVIIKTLNLAASEAVKRGIPQGDYVKVIVTDTGTGMDEATKAKAFDPFFTTKGVGKGTGLGLSMLYGFVNQSGGHVRIESEEGSGTSVYIYLPRSLEEPVTMQSPEATITPLFGEGKTVLLVEDEEIVRNLVKDVLLNAGYEVIDRPEGNAALKVVAENAQQINLLITDVGLPGLNGKQVAEMSRQARPDLKVLFITGYAAGITLREDLLTHGNDMLLKPFTMDTLLAKVGELIGAQQEQKAA